MRKLEVERSETLDDAALFNPEVIELALAVCLCADDVNNLLLHLLCAYLFIDVAKLED